MVASVVPGTYFLFYISGKAFNPLQACGPSVIDESEMKKLFFILPLFLLTACEAMEPAPMQPASELFAEAKTLFNDDPVKALEYVSHAAEQGDPEAQLALADYYYWGNMPDPGKGFRSSGKQRDLEQAKLWAVKAIAGMEVQLEQGNTANRMQLANIYFWGYSYEELKNEKRAFLLWNEEANDGNVDAMLSLAQFADEQFDGVTIENWLLTAANEGHAGAASLLSWSYMTGRRGISQDNRKAFQWTLRAAELGDDRAKETLQSMQAQGLLDEHNQLTEKGLGLM